MRAFVYHVLVGQGFEQSEVPRTQEPGNSERPNGADEKSGAWYTAFYHLANCIRQITDGALNYKRLYALMGSKGRYINHSNPMVRKRTAGTLSRLIHTKRYVLDMRDAYAEDQSVFDMAASCVCATVREAQVHEPGEFDLAGWIIDVCWPAVRTGLINEASEWRRGLDLLRLDREMELLFEAYRDGRPDGESVETAESLLSAILYIIAFDYLDVSRSRALVDAGAVDALTSERSTFSGGSFTDGVLACASAPDCGASRACLMRFVDQTCAMLSGFWEISRNEPFTIGRYTDCQAIELSGEVSRVHCRIAWEDGSWRIRDAESRKGGKVFRGGKCVLDAPGGFDASFGLEYGDVLVLPNGSTYLFAAMGAATQMAVTA